MAMSWVAAQTHTGRPQIPRWRRLAKVLFCFWKTRSGFFPSSRRVETGASLYPRISAMARKVSRPEPACNWSAEAQPAA